MFRTLKLKSNSRPDYTFLLCEKIASFFFIGIFFFLVLVFTLLVFSHAGASRWLDLGFMFVQPAELLKFSFIIYLAAWLAPRAKGADKGKSQKEFWTGDFPFLVFSGL